MSNESTILVIKPEDQRTVRGYRRPGKKTFR
jgi:hypothetical protein